jgi:uncharacterized membrane protein
MNERTLNRILDVIIYSCFIFVLIWSILKGIGVINTPLLVQQLPVIAGTLGVLGFAYKIGRLVERIEQRFVQHNLKFTHIEKDIAHMHGDLEFLKQRV